jgi:hypothetical protein
MRRMKLSTLGEMPIETKHILRIQRFYCGWLTRSHLRIRFFKRLRRKRRMKLRALGECAE